MINLTVISHSCVLPENQKLWARVARHPEISLSLIAPLHWAFGAAGTRSSSPPCRSLPTASNPVRAYWPGQLHLPHLQRSRTGG